MNNECRTIFEALTGYPSFLWQQRLFDEFAKGQDHFPSVIDLPTGLGKTMVMAIWLIARAKHPDMIPTRLIYVVDRRTVVDQATDLAQMLIQRPITKWMHDAFHGEPPAISTLRGQLADNREWSRDPSRPAIIIGTVDLIGSALLFSGYRSSYKRRPLEAGLLGQDSLLVLDEAHLSKPFEKLIDDICDTGRFQQDCDKKLCGRPMKVIRMSATSGNNSNDNVFRLKGDFEARTDDFADDTVRQRYEAKKRLKIVTVGKVDHTTLGDEAIKLADNPELKDNRIVVFVRRPEDAHKISNRIRENGKSKNKTGRFVDAVAILTGTMRGLERDELLIKDPIMKRFLAADDPEPNTGPCFLVCTSAGEVGFDLNADHMVCDATTLDSLIQRLGRVNRRGRNDATVIMLVESEPKASTALDQAILAATNLLNDDMDVSPKALATFKNRLSAQQIEATSSPKPTMVELTDILLDAWSMTSIVEPMPGRPTVGPWLRGIDEELPQSTIAWRAELDLDGFADLDIGSIEEWFDTHRILTHETLTVPTASKSERSAEKWLLARWEQLGKTLGEEDQRRIGARPVILDQSGLKIMPLAELIGDLKRGNTSSIRFANLILPASFGGIERYKGLLDPSAPEVPSDENKKPFEEQRIAQSQRQIAPDVADIAPGWERLRESVTTTEEGKQPPIPIAAGKKPSKPTRLLEELESDDDRRVQLVSYVPRREKPEFGSGNPEPLAVHVRQVRSAIDAIIMRFSQSDPNLLTDTVVHAAQLAADWHDHGKNRQFFQRTVGGTCTPGTTDWMNQKTLEGNGSHQCLGKSDGKQRGIAPRGYRHEFGSLREFTDSMKGKVNDDVFDLAMHMIATHHGRGRPHFSKGGFDPDCEAQSDGIHTDSIRRFARLQRKYGWWQLAWLENLLRCADALASADHESEDLEGAEP
ncbi:MAG: type I-U CRISPR-associated helicase/endonuclease Cas3 [Pirellulales bacterium]